MSPLEHLVPARMDPAQRQLYDRIAGGPRGRGPQHFALTRADGSLTGPFNVLVHAPAVGEAVQALGAAIRFQSGLTDRVRELAILAVAAHVQSTFEWGAHAAIGRAVGLTDDEIEAIAGGRIPEGLQPDEHAAIAYVRAVVRGGAAGIESVLPAETQVELCTLVGYYSMLALYLRVFDADEPARTPID